MSSNDYTEALRIDISNLAKKYLKVDHSAWDPSGEILTGRNYQSVTLNGDTLEGFRDGAMRIPFIDSLPDSDGLFLDIGSNLGELSRKVARSGRLVLGIEYDAFTSALANLIHISNGFGNVTSIRADITDCPLPDKVESIIAFSVFRFIDVRLNELKAIFKDVMLIETHHIDGPNALDRYWSRLTSIFPAVALVGYTDHRSSGTGRRCVFAVANKSHKLWEYIFNLPINLIGHANLFEVDFKDIRFHFLESLSCDERLLELRKSSLSSSSEQIYDNIFSVVNGLFRDQFQAVSKATLFDSMYWLSFLKGYVQWVVANKIVTDNNDYLFSLGLRLLSDSGLESNFRNVLSDREKLRSRISDRFIAFDKILNKEDEMCPPILMFQSRKVEKSFSALELLVDNCPEQLIAIDGYHRLFAHFICGSVKVKSHFITLDIDGYNR